MGRLYPTDGEDIPLVYASGVTPARCSPITPKDRFCGREGGGEGG